MERHDFSDPERSRDEFLFWQLASGSISREDFQRLESLLLSDEDCRGRYVEYMGVEARLYELHGAKGDVSAAEAESVGTGGKAVGAGEGRGERRFAALRKWATWPLAALLAGMALVTAARLRVAPPQGPPRLAVEAPAAEDARDSLPGKVSGGDSGNRDAQDEAPMARTRFVASEIMPGAPQVAVVTEVSLPIAAADQSAPAAPLRVGSRLHQGVLYLADGEIQLEFLNGAQLRVNGPAELRLLSARSATLVSGQISARIPPHAQGFVLNTLKTAVVDYGTEFAVSTDTQGRGEVHVLEGEVEVSLLGDDGETILSERVRESKTLRVSNDFRSLVPQLQPSLEYAPLKKPFIVPLAAPDAYVEEVLRGDPLIYWRFESLTDGKVENSAGADWPARIVELGESPTLFVENGFARFIQGSAARYFDVELNDDWPALNRQDYSVELWFNPDFLHWGAILAVSPEADEPTERHLTIVEIAHATPMVHTPGTVRFLHRFPPRGHGGMNLFAQQGCTPGLWHHVVGVKTTTELRLYVNGALVKTLQQKQRNERGRYLPILGQIKRHNAERQFSGGVDEFALYLRALSAEEIQRHYELVVGPDDG